jgi:hypothetical protein
MQMLSNSQLSFAFSGPKPRYGRRCLLAYFPTGINGIKILWIILIQLGLEMIEISPLNIQLLKG